MNSPTFPRILQSSHEHEGDRITLFITRHDGPTGQIYRLENLTGDKMFSWGSEDKVKGVAAILLREAGHVCSRGCRQWQQISN